MLTRRDFLRFCLQAGGATFFLTNTLLPYVAKALTNTGQKMPVIWLEAATCAGNVLSTLNTVNPDMVHLLQNTISMLANNSLMWGEGPSAIAAMEEGAERYKNEYILIVEGTIATRDDGHWCELAHRPDGRAITALEMVKYLGDRARYVMAVGSCAAFGGPYAANPNPSNSKPVGAILKSQVINVPGCPVHPDWAIGTLSHLLLWGVPELDAYRRPKIFYGKLIHDFCPRRQHFENGVFAKQPGDAGCLYKIGCKGPVTYSDCPTRQWSSQHINWPVEANTPCIGCVNPDFPDRMSPFFAHLPNVNLPGIKVTANQIGLAAGAATVVGVGGHLVVNAVKGRLAGHWVQGTESPNPGQPSPDLANRLADLTDQSGQDIQEQRTIQSHLIELRPGNPNRSWLNRIKRIIVPTKKKLD